MKCHDCRRELTRDEPVYRVLRKHSGASVCAGCVNRTFVDKGRRWLSARQCERCGRPIIVDRVRKGLRIVTCSPECRKAIHDTRYRERHAKRPAAKRCEACGTSYVPKRDDAKFCSVTCKQRAYRARR